MLHDKQTCLPSSVFNIASRYIIHQQIVFQIEKIKQQQRRDTNNKHTQQYY
jgi:hypothetical protein